MREEAATCRPYGRRALHRLIVFALLLLAFGLVPRSAAADRGRPEVAKGSGPGLGATYHTFVSDTGTLLRGARWSSDLANQQGICPLPSRSAVTRLRSLGLNALHVYGETWNQGYNAGACQDTIDQLVDWTGEDGLYLILTIGNGSANGSRNPVFARAFWEKYAPRYRDRTHVLYEIQNEPYFDFGSGQAQPSPAALIDFEAEMYNLIRAAAPDTPVLFFTYAVFKNPGAVRSDVNALEAAIPSLDWSNEAIAFHGYATLAETENTLREVFRPDGQGWSGVPCVQTEFYDDVYHGQHVDQTILYEDTFTSWMTFVDVNFVAQDELYKNPLDNAWVVWAADFGTWPATSAPPLGRTVSLLAEANQRYVTAPNSTNPLIATASAVGPSEKFTVVASQGRWVSLFAQSPGQYVSAANSGAGPLIANSVGLWRELEWMKRPDGTVVLRARANNKIVSADLLRSNPPELIANRKQGGPWERFVVRYLPEIVWRNSTTGANRLWTLSASGLESESPLTAVSDLRWSIVGDGDFNADGKPDLLWRDTNGSNYLWLMDGPAVTSAVPLPAVTPGWSVAAVGDANGDAKADVFWRSDMGANYLWLMDGATVTSAVALPAVETSWSIAGAADFNRDGKSDLFWRRNDGENYVWLMDGANVSLVASTTSAGTNWTVAGTGDFDGDGYGDVFWHSRTTGATYVWFMQDTSVRQASPAPAAPPEWSPVAFVDLDLDGKTDIVWRKNNGENYLWLMDGAQALSALPLPSLAPDWIAAAPR